MIDEISQTARTAAAARAAHLIVDREPYIFADALAAPLLGDRAEELPGYHRLRGDQCSHRCDSAATWPAPPVAGVTKRRGPASCGWHSRGKREPAISERRADPAVEAATEAFVAHRNLLFTVAYEMLGSAADAEDVLQETWLRWVDVNIGTVRDPRAYLVRITTRQALTRLRTLRRRKESYVGSWLPEPLLTAPDVAEDVALADSVSMAMLLVLETLTPTERAVFVLREVFDLEYDEIAEAVDKSPAAIRQIAHRARAHVAARRPRGVVSAAEAHRALAAFQRAIETGDLQGLIDQLAPDVVLVGDGGGVKQAVVRPVLGADRVARLLAKGLSRIAGAASAEPVQINGGPALIIRLYGEIDTVVAVRIDDGLITGLYAVRNPEKLSRVQRETAVSR